MGKKQEQDLRIMEQVHSSLLDTIALRDAEIEVLREELREMVAERDAEIAQLKAQVAELQAKVTRWDEVGTGILFFLNGKPGMDGYAMANFVDSLPKQVIEAMGRDPYEGTAFIRLSDV